MSINNYCRRDIEDNSLICYNCASQLPEDDDKSVITILDNFNKKVLLCNNTTTCKKEFDIDNQGKIININKVFRLIVGDGTGNDGVNYYYYCSSRRLLQAKQELNKILFQSTKKYGIDDFGSRYENDLDSTCYDNERRMICSYCKKLIDLDDDENRKELWGGQPDAHSFIMHDGCTVLIFCDKDCVELSYGF